MNIVKKNDKPINDLLKDFIKKNEQVKKAFAVIDIEEVFKEKMGPVVYSYTRKIYLRGPVLYINIVSAPLKAELQHSKQSLIELLNETIGDEMIKEIVFT
jgi:Dna[CI] antecedent, DciA